MVDVCFLHKILYLPTLLSVPSNSLESHLLDSKKKFLVTVKSRSNDSNFVRPHQLHVGEEVQLWRSVTFKASHLAVFSVFSAQLLRIQEPQP